MTNNPNNNFIIIGLTGPTGAGKTTAASAMSDLGCFIIDSDKIARDVLNQCDCIEQICSVFGNSIKKSDGKISRVKLANIAFSSDENTKKLNAITHPLILKQIKKEIKALKNKQNSIIVIDAPLLFESKLDKICNVIVSVITPENDRLKRIMKRDCLSEVQAKQRISRQHDNKFYLDNSDYTLDGSGRDCDLYKLASDLVMALRGDFSCK